MLRKSYLSIVMAMTVFVAACDYSGGLAGGETTDSTPPAVSVTPVITDDNTPTLSATVTDDKSGVATVTITVVGVNGYAATGAGAIWTTAAIPTLADGTYDIRVTAEDVDGNSVTTTSYVGALVVDTVDPVVAIDAMGSIANPTPTITGTVSDADTGVAGVSVNVDGVDYPATVTGGTWTVDITTALTAGTYEVVATATDVAGNEKVDGTTNELIITSDAPNVTVTSLTTSDTTPTVTGTAAVVVGLLDNVSVLINGKTYTADISGAPTWTVTIPAGDALVDGVYEVAATATDSLTNSGSDATNNELTIDITGPVITGAVTDAGAWDDLTLTFDWAAATDARSSVSHYLLTVGTTPGGNDIVDAQNVGDVITYDVVRTAADEGKTLYAFVEPVDSLGNTGTKSNNSDGITIDVTAPTVPVATMSEVITGWTGAEVQVSWTASTDANGIDGYHVYILTDGDVAVADADAGTDLAAIIDISGLVADGTSIKAYVVAADPANNPALSAETTAIQVDVNAPTVSIDAETTNDSTPTLSGTFTETGSGIEYVIVTIDGNDYVATIGAGTYTVDVGAVLADNSYNATATAYDYVGQMGTSTSALVVVDTVDPALTSDTSSTTDNTPTLTGTTNDTTSGVLSVVVNVNGTDYTAAIAGIDWSVDVTNVLADGIYDIVTTSTDVAGNSITITETDGLLVDTTDPVVTVNTLLTSSPASTISGTVTDVTSGVVSVNIVIVGGNSGPAVIIGNTWSFNAVVPNPAPLSESFDVIATATDNLGNIGTDATGNEFTVDPSVPAISINSQVTNNPSPMLSGNIAGIYMDYDIWVTIEGQPPMEYAGMFPSGMMWNYNAPLLSDGVYDVTVQAQDTMAMGPMGEVTVSDALTVDATAPVTSGTPTLNSSLKGGQPYIGPSLTVNWEAATDATTGVNEYIVTLYREGLAIMGPTTTNTSWTFDLINDPLIPSNEGEEFYVIVSVSDNAGNSVSYPNTETAQLDKTSPTADWFGRSPNQDPEDVTAVCYYQFSEAMDRASTEAAITLNPAPTNGLVFIWDSSSQWVEIYPDEGVVGFDNTDYLQSNTSYNISLALTAEDIFGNTLSATSDVYTNIDYINAQSFTTKAADFTAPVLTNIDTATVNALTDLVPVDDVEEGDTLTFIFDEDLNISRGRIDVRTGFGNDVIRLELQGGYTYVGENLLGVAKYYTFDDHNLQIGDTIIISGLNEPTYNGLFTIVTTPEPYSFTTSAVFVDYSPQTGVFVPEVMQGEGVTASWFSSTTLVLTLGNALTEGTDYSVRLDDFQDTSDNRMNKEVVMQIAKSASSPDLTPPVFLGSVPSDDPLGLDEKSCNSTIYMTFTEPVAFTSAAGWSVVADTTGDITANFELEYMGGDGPGAGLILTPIVAMPADEFITVTLPATIEDLAGNQMGTAATFTFKVEFAANGAPTLGATLPADGEQYASDNNNSIQLSFVDSLTGRPEVLDAATVTDSEFLVKNLSTGQTHRGWAATTYAETGIVRLEGNLNGLWINSYNYMEDPIITTDGSSRTYVLSQPHYLQTGDVVSVMDLTMWPENNFYGQAVTVIDEYSFSVAGAGMDSLTDDGSLIMGTVLPIVSYSGDGTEMVFTLDPAYATASNMPSVGDIVRETWMIGIWDVPVVSVDTITKTVTVASDYSGSGGGGRLEHGTYNRFEVTVSAQGGIADINGSTMPAETINFMVNSSRCRPVLRDLNDGFRISGNSSPTNRSFDIRIGVHDSNRELVTVDVTDIAYGGVIGVGVIKNSETGDTTVDTQDNGEFRFGSDGPVMMTEPTELNNAFYSDTGWYVFDAKLTDGQGLTTTETQAAFIWAPADVPYITDLEGFTPTDADPILLDSTNLPAYEWTNVDTDNADTLMFISADLSVMNDGGNGGYMFGVGLPTTTTNITTPDDMPLSTGIYLYAVMQQKFRTEVLEDIAGQAWSMDLVEFLPGPIMNIKYNSLFVYGPSNTDIADNTTDYAIGHTRIKQGEEDGSYSFSRTNNFFGTYTLGSKEGAASDVWLDYAVLTDAGTPITGTEMFAYDSATQELVLADSKEQFLSGNPFDKFPMPGTGYMNEWEDVFVEVQRGNTDVPYLTVGARRDMTRVVAADYDETDLYGDWSVLFFMIDNSTGSYDSAHAAIGSAFIYDNVGTCEILLNSIDTSGEDSSGLFTATVAADGLVSLDIGMGDMFKGYLGGDNNDVLTLTNDLVEGLTFMFVLTKAPTFAVTSEDIEGTYRFGQMMVEQDDSGAPYIFNKASTAWGEVTFIEDDATSGTYTYTVTTADGEVMTGGGDYSIEDGDTFDGITFGSGNLGDGISEIVLDEGGMKSVLTVRDFADGITAADVLMGLTIPGDDGMIAPMVMVKQAP